MKRSLDNKKIKSTFRIIIIVVCIVFIVSWTGAFFAVRQQNQTVALIALNPSETRGVVIDSYQNATVIKTIYEFHSSGKKYSGQTFENYNLSTGEAICIAFNKDNPSENVYCSENKIIDFNFTIYSIKVVAAFFVVLFVGYLWKFIVGDKRFIVELTSRRK